MGFSIGSFLGSIAPVIGGIFGGPVGAALGGAVGAGFATATAPSVIGRQTAPAMQRPQQLTSVVPVPVNVPRPSFGGSARFAGGGGTRSLVGGATSTIARAVGLGFGTLMTGAGVVSEILTRSRENVGPGVTKKKIIAAARTCGIELAADTFGISESDVCKVIVSGAGRRRRGVSAADIRRTKRTLRFVKKIRADVKSIRL